MFHNSSPDPIERHLAAPVALLLGGLGLVTFGSQGYILFLRATTGGTQAQWLDVLLSLILAAILLASAACMYHGRFRLGLQLAAWPLVAAWIVVTLFAGYAGVLQSQLLPTIMLLLLCMTRSPAQFLSAAFLLGLARVGAYYRDVNLGHPARPVALVGQLLYLAAFVWLAHSLMWALKAAMADRRLLAAEADRAAAEAGALRASAEAMREKLAAAERLAPLGSLVGQVVHDGNNMVTAMKLGLELLRLEVPAQPRPTESIRSLHQAASRLQAMFKDLLLHALHSRGEETEFDVRQQLRELEPVCAALLGARGRLRLDLPAGPAPLRLRMVPVQLDRIVVNLVANARDALRSPEGVVEIGARAGAEGWVEIWVRDEGVGIPASLREKIFQPFFTTKQGTGGTGLGLSAVQTILYSLGGRLSVESVEGQGTTMRLELPGPGHVLSSAPTSPRREHLQPAATLWVANARTATLVRCCLHDRGYAVAPATASLLDANAATLAPHGLGVVDLDDVAVGDGVALLVRMRAMTGWTWLLLGTETPPGVLAALNASRDAAPGLVRKPFFAYDFLSALPATRCEPAAVPEELATTSSRG